MALEGILVGGGVVDADFRGNICVILANITPIPRYIEKHERIAQLLVEKISDETAIIQSQFPTDSKTKRGKKGFGSSGKF